MTTTTTTTHTLNLVDIGLVEVTVDERGEGQPFLLLHGGGGPDTMRTFAELFANTHPARVITPIHPGFGGTARTSELRAIRELAALYAALLDQLELSDVTAVGNSIDGWIAAELGLLESPRVSGVILVDAVGIEVPGNPIADFFSLSMDQVFELSFHDPTAFRIDSASVPAAAQMIMAGNRSALATYAGTSMSDPSLIERLSTMETPSLVLWGDSDRIVDPEYGRAYAAAIPTARFPLLGGTGHLPQLETPGQLLQVIRNYADTDFSNSPTHSVVS